MQDTYKHKGMRQALVNAIREKGIKNEKVLEAINKVPRHFFLDSAFLEHAYQDKAFAIGEGQTISQPYTVAFQTELLDIKVGDKVLEIGTGSGYQCCILLEMGAKVYTIEYNRILYNRARKLLQHMGYQAHFVCGDGSLGLPALAPFDKILVTAGAPSVPPSLVTQLKEYGTLVIPVGEHKKQQMYKITKLEGQQTQTETHDHFSFVPLLGKEGWNLIS